MLTLLSASAGDDSPLLSTMTASSVVFVVVAVVVSIVVVVVVVDARGPRTCTGSSPIDNDALANDVSCKSVGTTEFVAAAAVDVVAVVAFVAVIAVVDVDAVIDVAFVEVDVPVVALVAAAEPTTANIELSLRAVIRSMHSFCQASEAHNKAIVLPLHETQAQQKTKQKRIRRRRRQSQHR